MIRKLLSIAPSMIPEILSFWSNIYAYGSIGIHLILKYSTITKAISRFMLYKLCKTPRGACKNLLMLLCVLNHTLIHSVQIYSKRRKNRRLLDQMDFWWIRARYLNNKVSLDPLVSLNTKLTESSILLMTQSYCNRCLLKSE